jgi:hypothetical protein
MHRGHHDSTTSADRAPQLAHGTTSRFLGLTIGDTSLPTEGHDKVTGEYRGYHASGDDHREQYGLPTAAFCRFVCGEMVGSSMLWHHFLLKCPGALVMR